MASSNPSVRRRKPDPEPEPTNSSSAPEELEPTESESEQEKEQKPPKRTSKKATVKDRLDADDDYPRTALLLDIFRVLTFLFLVSCGLSYLISGGESFFWGMSDPPRYMTLNWWKKQFVRLCSSLYPLLFPKQAPAPQTNRMPTNPATIHSAHPST